MQILGNANSLKVVLSLQADSHNTYEEEDLRKTNSLNSNITSQLDFISMIFFSK